MSTAYPEKNLNETENRSRASTHSLGSTHKASQRNVQAGTQKPALAVQNGLATTDVPIGGVVILFSQPLGGAPAACIAVANSLLLNCLINLSLAVHAPSLDVHLVLSLVPTHLKQGLGDVCQLVLEGVYRAYNDTIVVAIYVSTVVASLSALEADLRNGIKRFEKAQER
ncbi:hypothetical protein BJ165DRAFT_1608121 [Panaeolus papilionaceus]|nr:hypothetical protein BJ165DRAFT_1608121 [Panaeolus papilionaceus]